MVSSSKGESASDGDNSSGDAPEAESKSLFSEGEKDNPATEKLIKIQIPASLKKRLVDDWEFITRQNKSDAGGAMHRKSKLTLPRPKTPEFETSQRVRSVKIKSSAEKEEEMMAKIPKFKARPLNKKIFEASTLSPLPRNIPHCPEFKLVKFLGSPNVDDIATKFLEHRSKKDGMNIVGNPNFAHENHAIKKQTPDGKKSKQIRTVNKPSNLPHKTRTGRNSSNFCPTSAKSAFKEDKVDRKMYVREPAAAPFVSMAEMMKKFQTGTREMSLPRNSCSLYQSDAGGAMHRKSKLTLTRPKTPEFETSQCVRFVKIKSSAEIEEEMMAKIPKFKARPLNKKIFEASTLPPLPRSIPHLPQFKLSKCSESQCEKPFPRNTTPNPFHLQTEERGAEKERRVAEELMQKQYEEERARVPRAHPYPYTTDYPVIPPKPEPKPCMRPEPFQLESLLRHEQEMQREMEERRRMEMEEAEMRKFKAQPILQEDPIPFPEKERRPLTEVQEFNLLVENRAVERSKFDKKIKEKEMMYQRYKEVVEAAKMMEEEKALKQLRRTLVHHARPVPRFDHPFLPQK